MRHCVILFPETEIITHVTSLIFSILLSKIHTVIYFLIIDSWWKIYCIFLAFKDVATTCALTWEKWHEKRVASFVKRFSDKFEFLRKEHSFSRGRAVRKCELGMKRMQTQSQLRYSFCTRDNAWILCLSTYILHLSLIHGDEPLWDGTNFYPLTHRHNTDAAIYI